MEGAMREMRLICLCGFRCNNVLWISAAKGAENGDTKMEG